MNIHGFSLFIGKRIYNMQNNAADKLSPFTKLTIEQQNLITQIISFTKQHINRNLVYSQKYMGLKRFYTQDCQLFTQIHYWRCLSALLVVLRESMKMIFLEAKCGMKHMQ